MNVQTLTDLQLELLKLYSTNLDQRDLLEIKRMLAHFFAPRAIKEADRIGEEKGLSDEDMEKWVNE